MSRDRTDQIPVERRSVLQTTAAGTVAAIGLTAVVPAAADDTDDEDDDADDEESYALTVTVEDDGEPVERATVRVDPLDEDVDEADAEADEDDDDVFDPIDPDPDPDEEDDLDDDVDVDDDAAVIDPDEEIELGGRTSGWVGQAPEQIEGERNPTLTLVEAEEYELTWENLDGIGHNIVIEDEDGEEEFLASDVVAGAGETQTVEFEAEAGMAEYYCGPHPQSMRGEIVFDDAAYEEETDEDGVAEFELADGEYEVTAEDDDREAEDEVEIDGDDEELTLALEEATD